MKTALRNIAFAVGCFVIIWFAVAQIDAALFAVFGIGADDTDSASARSGLGLRIDSGTGCQYLVSPWGGIVPRYDGTGKQMCGGNQ